MSLPLRVIRTVRYLSLETSNNIKALMIEIIRSCSIPRFLLNPTLVRLARRHTEKLMSEEKPKRVLCLVLSKVRVSLDSRDKPFIYVVRERAIAPSIVIKDPRFIGAKWRIRVNDIHDIRLTYILLNYLIFK